MNIKSHNTSKHWDIFCNVVDNFGDIGVTWRLAKQLVAEFNIPVKLWVNNLSAFKQILPQLEMIDEQQQQGVTILNWPQPFSCSWQAGHVLIEAFACQLPEVIINKLSFIKQPPIWINLEYLSAEDWVLGCHGLSSIQPNGVAKYFFFPGFHKKTGGLLRESDLLKKRAQWQRKTERRAQFFEKLIGERIQKHDVMISYFSYDNRFLLNLLKLKLDKIKLHILMPTKCISIKQSIMSNVIDNHIILYEIPFTTQEGYDQLLWSCDLNIVRGEDSFIRAQWAGRPFFWHIYPQDEQAHLVKLNAFMQLYTADLAPELAELWQKLNLLLNRDATDERNNLELEVIEELGQKFVEYCKRYSKHAKIWSNRVLIDTDLTTRLVQFVKNI